MLLPWAFDLSVLAVISSSTLDVLAIEPQSALDSHTTSTELTTPSPNNGRAQFSRKEVVEYFLTYEAFSSNLYAEFDVIQVGPTPLSDFSEFPSQPWVSDQVRHIGRYRWMTQGEIVRIDMVPISLAEFEMDENEDGFLTDPSLWCSYWDGQNCYERRPPYPVPGGIEYVVLYQPALPSAGAGFPLLTGFYPWPSIIGPEAMSHLVASELVLEEQQTDDTFLIRFARRSNPDGFKIAFDFEITSTDSLRLRSIVVDVISNEEDPELRTVLRKTFQIDRWMDVGDQQLPEIAWTIGTLIQAPAFVTQGIKPLANCTQYRMRTARPFDPDIDSEALRRPVPRKGSMVYDPTLRLQYSIGESWLIIDTIAFQLEEPIDALLRGQLPQRMKTAKRKEEDSK